MDEHPENAIASGLCRGDAEAWQQLYDAHAERIWLLVARALRGYGSEIADVVQETFLAAAQSARSFNPQRGSGGAWLTGIARRQVALFFRQRYRRGDLVAEWSSADAVSKAIAVEDGDPAAVVARADQASHVRQVLSTLSVEYETLLTLMYLDDFTAKQIADLHDSTEDAVRSKLARAKRDFRRRFERHVRDSHWTPGNRGHHES